MPHSQGLNQIYYFSRLRIPFHIQSTQKYSKLKCREANLRVIRRSVNGAVTYILNFSFAMLQESLCDCLLRIRPFECYDLHCEEYEGCCYPCDHDAEYRQQGVQSHVCPQWLHLVHLPRPRVYPQACNHATPQHALQTNQHQLIGINSIVNHVGNIMHCTREKF